MRLATVHTVHDTEPPGESGGQPGKFNRVITCTDEDCDGRWQAYRGTRFTKRNHAHRARETPAGVAERRQEHRTRYTCIFSVRRLDITGHLYVGHVSDTFGFDRTTSWSRTSTAL
ncbi:hypothetical protein FNV43_RR23595 [Rhamnella rubrinervis]|uniref:Uncharacterized protein n=1 Tax=Rhamnella rubrinervis TaxID=2594499 RepID=A0A8K0DY75_9ROSA|nr:hypothetical protein FNV43_RR23595 [Rhamnella rubrinervis]